MKRRTLRRDLVLQFIAFSRMSFLSRTVFARTKSIGSEFEMTGQEEVKF
jgi:hypothetical protein